MNKDIAYIYQVARNLREVGFMSWDYISENNLFDFSNYVKVAEIDLEKYNLTEDYMEATLENIFAFGNTNKEFYVNNPKARSISVSDIIELNNVFYYCDSFGFEEITPLVSEATPKIESKLVEADDVEQKELFDDTEDTKDTEDTEIDTEDDASLLDLLQARIGQQMTVGELNTVLQSLFAQYNKVFLMTSDLYNMDLDETQQLVVNDDEDMYVIYYDIVDMDKGIIEIKDVTIEN